MTLKKISFNRLMVRSYDLWANQWFLLTCGDFIKNRFNTMTVAWGSIGNMWNKPFVQVVVRPSRYTYEYMENYHTFTLCAFSRKYQQALELLGSKSGRYGDKIAETGLTPVKSTAVPAPCFAEAELILECRKMYWDDMESDHFIEAEIENNYSIKDYHRIYFGEIIAIHGNENYSG